MIGKVPPDLLEDLVLSRTGASDERVLQGPAYGEDTAAIQVGDDVLVVNTDPISLAVARVGTLGVHVACNDVAASGGTPEWLTTVIFLPGSSEDALDEITRQLDETASSLGVSIVGGHSEYAPALATPMLVVTCFGLTDRYVPTAGARPGDRILLTGSAGIEGTAILATDFEDRLADVPSAIVERGATFYDEISVVEDARIVSDYAHAMHDPTEGGIVTGLFELARASGVTLEADPDAIPVREETERLCHTAGVDPLRIFGSGSLVAAIPEESTGEVAARLDDADITRSFVGTVRASDDGTASLILGDETIEQPVRDEMYALWE